MNFCEISRISVPPFSYHHDSGCPLHFIQSGCPPLCGCQQSEPHSTKWRDSSSLQSGLPALDIFNVWHTISPFPLRLWWLHPYPRTLTLVHHFSHRCCYFPHAQIDFAHFLGRSNRRTMQYLPLPFPFQCDPSFILLQSFWPSFTIFHSALMIPNIFSSQINFRAP